MGAPTLTDSLATVDRPTRLRSRVSNGSKLIAGVDGRSVEARRYRDLVLSYADDCGGAAKLTEAQRTLIAQAATLQVQAERMQGAVIKGELVDVEQLSRLSNSVVRILSRLGLKRAVTRTPSRLDVMLNGAV
jgi:hypothetical protein